MEQVELGCKYNKKVEPLLYALRLILGVVFSGITLLYIIHMYNTIPNPHRSVLYLILRTDNIPTSTVINAMLNWLDSGSSRLLAIVVFAFFALYIMWAAMKGNLKVGIRLLFFKFYTLK